MPPEFFTFREYMKKDDNLLTASMEDYLEMIYRLSKKTGFARINDLAAALNVQPPSATKMAQKLSEAGFVKYEKYGMIILSKKGEQAGQALLRRHQIIENFLVLLGISGDILEETEKMEHVISARTLDLLANLVDFLKARPEIIQELNMYRKIKERP